MRCTELRLLGLGTASPLVWPHILYIRLQYTTGALGLNVCNSFILQFSSSSNELGNNRNSRYWMRLRRIISRGKFVSGYIANSLPENALSKVEIADDKNWIYYDDLKRECKERKRENWIVNLSRGITEKKPLRRYHKDVYNRKTHDRETPSPRIKTSFWIICCHRGPPHQSRCCVVWTWIGLFVVLQDNLPFQSVQ
jgi:hypothetical protein